jgi:hypothetical protein
MALLLPACPSIPAEARISQQRLLLLSFDGGGGYRNRCEIAEGQMVRAKRGVTAAAAAAGSAGGLAGQR